MTNWPKTLSVEVTEADIQNGHICGMYTCPIALATDRVLPKGYMAEVQQRIYIFESSRPLEEVVTYLHSEESKRFMQQFDAKTKVNPSTFVLTLAE